MKKLYRDAVDKLTPYVPGKPIQEVQRELGLADVIKMASNENPLGPSPRAVNAVRKAVEEIHYYPEGSCFELRKILAKKLGVEENQLIFGNGSDELLLMISQAFFNPGDEIIQGDPALTFVEYRAVSNIAGAEPVFVPMKNYGYDLAAMAEKINEKTKLVFIANPNNPTGSIVSKEEFAAFMEKVPEDVIVVLDEAYYEYVETADYPDSIDYIKNGANVIALRTFSKIFGLAGLRVGYGIARKELIDILERVRQPFNVNTLAQAGAAAALSDIRHVEASRRMNKEGREYFYGSFEVMGLKFVQSEANFVLVDVKKNGKEVAKRLTQEGIIVRAIGTETTIRVTVGTKEQNERFIKTLKNILK